MRIQILQTHINRSSNKTLLSTFSNQGMRILFLTCFAMNSIDCTTGPSVLHRETGGTHLATL
ncbi:hypothetical protein Mapa_006460 [Marchantia paleacea]|nr:hypothetical protein Mapa_006460 [Marchantia paleacea]